MKKMKSASFLLLNNISLLSVMNLIVFWSMMITIFASTSTTASNVTRIEITNTGSTLFPAGNFCLGKL